MAIIDKIQLSGTVYTIGNETTTAVTSASTDNEIPTAKAVYDAIPQGGGGKAIEAGRAISITTGETADTVSLNLPISAITGTDIMYGGDNNSVSITNGISNYNNFFGSGNTISVSGLSKTSAMYNIVLGNENSVNFKGAEESWEYSLIIGQNNSASYSTYMGRSSAYNIICGFNNTIGNNISNCFVMGSYNKPKKKFNTNIGDSLNTTNDYEFALATCNVSSSATTSFGNSGNTLFSVGNGSSSSARHNAFEIRQNGDIYIADTNDTSTTNYYEKPMIRLQDHLGGGGSSYTAGDGIDITNDVISVTGKVDTSAFTAHTADTVIHVTSAEKAAWNNKQDVLVSGTNIKTINGETLLGEGNIEIQGGGSSINVVQTTGTSTADVMSQDAITNAFRKTNLVSASYSSGHLDLECKDPFNTSYRTMLKFGTINGMTVANIGSERPSFSLVETSAITTSVTSSSTDAQVPSAKAVYDKLGGLKLVKLTQSEYNSLTTKDSSTLYIING